MNNNLQTPRDRLLAAVRSGDWERVPGEVEAYGAAVRADERRRALDDVVRALEELFDSDGIGSGREWRQRCLAVVERLR
jgi:hypothetical protein